MPKCGKPRATTRCGACREGFTGSLQAFDAHRFGPFSHRRCVPRWAMPLLGLIEVNGEWGFMTPEQHAARRERLANMRAQRNAG